MTLRCVDLFCGAGGMSLGFANAGFKVVAAYDNESRHIEVYKNNLGQHATVRDVASLGEDDYAGWGDVDVIVGGAPCQGFSEAGKKKAADPRNQLLLEFARIVVEAQPRAFVLENVPGILVGRYSSLLKQFIKTLRDGGYHVPDVFVPTSAALFGVPQQRRRVFVIGASREWTMPPVLTTLSGAPTSVWDAIGDLPRGKKLSPDRDIYEGRLGKPSEYARRLRQQVSDDEPVVLSGCAVAHHCATTVTRFRATKPGQSETVSRFMRLTKSGLSPTLRAGTTPTRGSFTAARPIHPTEPRCITVREAARLHGYPDRFEFHSTKWYGYMQIGNSVPPPMATAVAKAVERLLV